MRATRVCMRRTPQVLAPWMRGASDSLGRFLGHLPPHTEAMGVFPCAAAPRLCLFSKSVVAVSAAMETGPPQHRRRCQLCWRRLLSGGFEDARHDWHLRMHDRHGHRRRHRSSNSDVCASMRAGRSLMPFASLETCRQDTSCTGHVQCLPAAATDNV